MARNSIEIAEKAFEELLSRTNHEKDPDKWDLYVGLANIAGVLHDLAATVNTIRSDVSALKRQVH